MRTQEPWQWRRAQSTPKNCTERWPLEPLLDLLHGHLGDDYSLQNCANACQVNVRRWARFLAAGSVSVYQADDLAIGLGLHPSNIWTGWFEAVKAA